MRRPPFPIDEPIRSRSPAVAVDEEGEVRVVQEKLAVEAFNRDWVIVFTGDKVKRGICVVKQRLRLQCLKAHNLKATSAGNAELGAKEVYRL